MSGSGHLVVHVYTQPQLYGISYTTDTLIYGYTMKLYVVNHSPATSDKDRMKRATSISTGYNLH